jgi:hypothetical protein
LEGYAIAATKNQVFEAILIMMLRSLQAISRAFFMINLPSRVQEHEKWIRDRLKIEVYNGLDLWNRKEELFPSLEFCENVNKQLQEIGNGEPILKQIIKRLLELEEYCKSWTAGSFNSDTIPCKVSPESNSRLKQFKEELTFKCPDGIKRIFSLHVRMTPGAWRLHFFTELGPGKIIIGYIGLKIQ